MFLTIYTPTYKRPKGLAANMWSVCQQTLVHEVEHLVVPDYVGLGVGGMYRRTAYHRDAINGRYVVFLCDDDVLASPTVVSELEQAASHYSSPPLMLVQTRKNEKLYPIGDPWPPRMGYVDLNCIVMRADLWRRFVHAFGDQYEGDYHFLQAVHDVGIFPVNVPLLFSTGGVNHGEPEPFEGLHGTRWPVEMDTVDA